MLWATATYHGPAVAQLSLYGLANLLLIPEMKTHQPSMTVPRRVSRAQLEKEFKQVPASAIHTLAVTDAHCRWPVGDIKWLSCGAAANGRYCAYHTGIADNKKTPASEARV